MATQQTPPNIGETPAANVRRDAIHVACAAVEAGEDLNRGDRVSVVNGKAYFAGYSSDGIGLVDPWLKSPAVRKGERFWLLMDQGIITSLRHQWTHPAFATAAPDAVHVLPTFEEVLRDG